jgi:RNA polymerase sigma-70 factor, ECF subfamily
LKSHIWLNRGLSVLPDEDLMGEIVRGNASAFEVLYHRYVFKCSSLAMKIVHYGPVAEEVVQEVFLRLWKQPSAFSMERGKFSSWLLAVVHNCAVDKMRTSKPDAHHVRVLSLDMENDATTRFVEVLQDNGPTPYDYAWSGERGRIVNRLLSLLNDTQRQVIEMAYLEGLTYREIAERLDKPISTIKTRSRLGRRHLRDLALSTGLTKELA